MSTPNNPRRRRIAGERRRADDEQVTIAETPTAPAPPATTPPSKTPTPASAPEEPPRERREKPQKREKKAESPRTPEPDGAPESLDVRPRRLSGRMLAVLAAVTTALVATVIVLGLFVWDVREVRENDAEIAAGRAAGAAAERAAVAVLSYDYQSLDQSLATAQSFLDDEFEAEFTDSFESFVRDNAPELQAVVTATVPASAVVNVDLAGDRDRAEILVFVDQTTVSRANGGEPSLALNRVIFDMVKVGDSWLVGGFRSS